MNRVVGTARAAKPEGLPAAFRSDPFRGADVVGRGWPSSHPLSAADGASSGCMWTAGKDLLDGNACGASKQDGDGKRSVLFANQSASMNSDH